MRQPRCALHAPDVYPLHPTPFLLFFPLPIRQALGPAEDSTTRPPWQAGVRHSRATSQSCADGRLVAVIGIRDERWERPRPQPLLSLLHQGAGRLVGPCADDE